MQAFEVIDISWPQRRPLSYNEQKECYELFPGALQFECSVGYWRQ